MILDECLPKRLGRLIEGHEIETVPGAGLGGLTNGSLLNAIQGAFDAFITIDGNIEYQQALSHRPFSIIIVKSISNRLEDLIPLVPAITAALNRGHAGEIIHVG